MNKLIVWSILTAIAAAIAVSLFIQHRTEAGLRTRRILAQQQVDELAQLSTENQRLSNLVVQLASSRSLSGDQLKELLKLRNEAGRLRDTGTERTNLQAANEQLRATVAKSERELAEAQAAPNYWPKDKLSFAGYADPESSVRTMLWAMNSGDAGSWRSMMSPKALAEFEMSHKGKSEMEKLAEMKAMGEALIAAAAGFHVVDQRSIAPDLTIVSLSFDGEGKTRKFVLRKVGNEWKFLDLVLDGQPERDY